MLLFDLVFKSGEFYGDEGSFFKDVFIPVFTSALGAGIGAYVTWKIFRGTLENDRIKEERSRNIEKEREERIKAEEKNKEARAIAHDREKELEAKNNLENERLLYLHQLVSNSIKFTEHFRDSLNKFYSDFEKDEMVLPQLDQIPSNDLQRITYNIDREEHFHSYRIHVKKQGILRFYGFLDYIEQVRIQIFDSLGRAKTYDFENKFRFREKLDELTDYCHVYLQNYKLGKIHNREERNKVNNQLVIKTEITNNNPVAYQDLSDYFARPLAQYYVDNDIKELSPEFIEIANLAGKIIKLPSEIKANNRRVAESLKSYADALEPVLEKLKEEFKGLDEYCNQTFPDQS